MSIVAEVTTPTGEVERFRFPSKRVYANARAALLQHGFDLLGLQRWLAKYGRYLQQHD